MPMTMVATITPFSTGFAANAVTSAGHKTPATTTTAATNSTMRVRYRDGRDRVVAVWDDPRMGADRWLVIATPSPLVVQL